MIWSLKSAFIESFYAGFRYDKCCETLKLLQLVLCVFLFLGSCPSSADQTVIIESNGESASNYFSFRMFRFTGKNANVYLHCNLSLCLNENNSCIPVLFQKYSHRHKYMQATLHPILLIVDSICIWMSYLWRHQQVSEEALWSLAWWLWLHNLGTVPTLPLGN